MRSKILTGLLMATVIYWVGMALLSGISFAVMGVSGFNTTYQVDSPYCIYNVTFGQLYLIILVCGYIASLLSASVCHAGVSKDPFGEYRSVYSVYPVLCLTIYRKGTAFWYLFPAHAGSAP